MLEYLRCPVCKETYPPPAQSCPNDGSALELTRTLIGQTLDNRFRIESLLGVGGMGAVYRAMHLHLESYFAVKVLHPQMIADEAAIERFRREAKAARRIHHPNAIEVTDFGVTAEKLVYLVMEIVEGHLLRDLIREGVFDYHRATEILCQVCSAIQEAHDKQVIHRDLKPENIIVRKDGYQEKVKVLDFGIAKLLEPDQPGEQRRVLTKAGSVIGTPQYMSPEQCKGLDPKQQSDIYTLGVIAYEMLSGQPPLYSPTPIGYLDMHIREQPAPLCSVAPNVPICIERVIMTALEKAPDDRQHSADELARQLRNAVREADEQIHQPTVAFQLPSGKITMSVTAETEITAHTEALSPSQQSGPGASSPARDDQNRQAPSLSPASLSGSAGPRKQGAKFKAPLIGVATVVILALGAAGGVYLYPFGKDTPKKGEGQALSKTVADKWGDEMVVIPGGKFVMGRNDSEREEEQPEHEVTVNDFSLDKHEITNEQYRRFVDATGYRSPLNWRGGSFPAEVASHPVTHVTWTDADAYCRWMGKRLPLEKEWEFAARNGPEGRIYPWGNVWYAGAANVASRESGPASVFGFKDDRSGLGVQGLAGNVSEWVADVLTSYDPSQKSPCPECRVIRGGNFKAGRQKSQATFRSSEYPDLPANPVDLKAYKEQTLPVVGFRCAK